MARRHASTRFYGFKRSREDDRDLVANPAGLVILGEVDLRKGPMPAVFDQGALGSCTANAIGAAFQFDRSLDLAPTKSRRLSRLDIYFQERKIEGSLDKGDTGAYGRDGFRAAQNVGFLLEKRWPYDIRQFTVEPPDGKRHKLTKSYASVSQDIDHIKAVLSNDQTIAFGFTVFDSFESSAVASSGIVPMPGRGEQSIGGHEVLAVGYLADYPDHVLCRNSWGKYWGIDGYFLLPWAYITNQDLASDLRTIVRPL